MRALLVAAVTVALGEAAHVSGGGTLPPALVTLALVAGTLAVTARVVGRRVGGITAVALLGAGQLVVHAVLGATGSMGCMASGATAALARSAEAAAMPGMAGMAAPAAHAAHAAGTGCAAGGALAAAPDPRLMLLAHVASTLVTAFLIARADRALWWLVELLRPLFRALPAPTTVPAARLTQPSVARRAARDAWRAVVSPRGPPTALRASTC